MLVYFAIVLTCIISCDTLDTVSRYLFSELLTSKYSCKNRNCNTILQRDQFNALYTLKIHFSIVGLAEYNYLVVDRVVTMFPQFQQQLINCIVR